MWPILSVRLKSCILLTCRAAKSITYCCIRLKCRLTIELFFELNSLGLDGCPFQSVWAFFVFIDIIYWNNFIQITNKEINLDFKRCVGLLIEKFKTASFLYIVNLLRGLFLLLEKAIKNPHKLTVWKSCGINYGTCIIETEVFLARTQILCIFFHRSSTSKVFQTEYLNCNPLNMIIYSVQIYSYTLLSSCL